MRISGIERLSAGSVRDAAGLATLAFGVAGLSIWAAPGVPGWLGAGLALIMLAIATIDARWFIIPNELSAAGFALALINAAVRAQDGIAAAIGIALLRGAVLALLFLVLRMLYRRVRGRDGIGLGDVKLAGVMGAWLGWVTIPIAVEIAALSAIAVLCLPPLRARPAARHRAEISVRPVPRAEHLAVLAVRGDGAQSEHALSVTPCSCSPPCFAVAPGLRAQAGWRVAETAAESAIEIRSGDRNRIRKRSARSTGPGRFGSASSRRACSRRCSTTNSVNVLPSASNSRWT